MRRSALSGRVLRYLERAEAQEPNRSLQTDYRIAWITVSFASQDRPQPALWASLRVLGSRPEEVWPAIVVRRRAKLGALYEAFFPSEPVIELPPKKPPQAVKLVIRKNQDRAA